MNNNMDNSETISQLEERCRYLEEQLSLYRMRRHEHINQLNLIMAIANTVPVNRLEHAICKCIEEIVKAENDKNRQMDGELDLLEVFDSLNTLDNKSSELDTVKQGNTENENLIKIHSLYLNSIIRSVLLSKQKEAESKSIVFVSDTSGFDERDGILSGFSGYDGAELLINLINNAFDECSRLPREKRRFTLRIDKNSITASNPMTVRELGFKSYNGNSLPKTTKGEGRGFGLQNVRDIVRRYNTDIKITASDYVFSVTITSR